MAGAPDATAVIQELSALTAVDLQDATVRKRALLKTQQLSGLLQDPVDTATQLVLSPYIAIAARVAVELELFRRIQRAPKQTITTAALAQATQAEPLLITRILRLLAGVGFVAEVGLDAWSSTPVTAAMARPPVAAGHRFVGEVLMTSAAVAPQYLREMHYRCPTEPTDGFIQFAQQTKLDVFAYLAERPRLLADFHQFMGHTMGAKEYGVDWYPVPTRLLAGADPATALLVDIGGGRGHDLQAFVDKYPGTGRVVLQDLLHGLQAIPAGLLDPCIECVPYDFFTPQPEKGARVYFMHHILHDWSDTYCLRILAQIRAAMTPGYSILLIHDLILPDIGASAYQCIWDMTMMTFNGGMERSRTQWSALLEGAGFEIVEFFVADPDADGIVEAVVKT